MLEDEVGFDSSHNDEDADSYEPIDEFDDKLDDGLDDEFADELADEFSFEPIGESGDGPNSGFNVRFSDQSNDVPNDEHNKEVEDDSQRPVLKTGSSTSHLCLSKWLDAQSLLLNSTLQSGSLLLNQYDDLKERKKAVENKSKEAKHDEDAADELYRQTVKVWRELRLEESGRMETLHANLDPVWEAYDTAYRQRLACEADSEKLAREEIRLEAESMKLMAKGRPAPA